MPKELWHLMLKVEYVEYLLKAIFKKKKNTATGRFEGYRMKVLLFH